MTLGFGGQYSIQLSYGRLKNGWPRIPIHRGEIYVPVSTLSHCQYTCACQIQTTRGRIVSQGDDTVIRNLVLVIAALVIFMLFAIVLAQFLHSKVEPAQASAVVTQRISAVGKVNLKGAASPAKAAATASSAASTSAAALAATDGATVYQTACFACHGTGAAGAPKLGDKSAWTERVKLGLDTLVASAVNGKNAMPPKGGNMSLSEDAIRAAVNHMLRETGLTAN